MSNYGQNPSAPLGFDGKAGNPPYPPAAPTAAYPPPITTPPASTESIVHRMIVLESSLQNLHQEVQVIRGSMAESDQMLARMDEKLNNYVRQQDDCCVII